MGLLVRDYLVPNTTVNGQVITIEQNIKDLVDSFCARLYTEVYKQLCPLGYCSISRTSQVSILHLHFRFNASVHAKRRLRMNVHDQY